MSSQRETTLSVRGMSCGSCVRHVDEALREVEGVRDVEVRLTEGKARVSHAGASEEAMLAALSEAGYESSVDG